MAGAKLASAHVEPGQPGALGALGETFACHNVTVLVLPVRAAVVRAFAARQTEGLSDIVGIAEGHGVEFVLAHVDLLGFAAPVLAGMGKEYGASGRLGRLTAGKHCSVFALNRLEVYMIPVTLPYTILIRWAAILILLTAMAGGLVKCGYSAGKASGDKKLLQHEAADAALAVIASEDARKAEREHAASLSEIAQSYEKEKDNAEKNHSRVVAGLRSGAVRLQEHWACDAKLPATEPRTGITDESARLRHESAAAIIAAADEADAQVRGLQTVTRADRATCGAKP